MWIEILKKSYTEDLKIKKNTVLGFIVIEPENSSQKHKTPKSKKKKKEKGTTENVERVDREKQQQQQQKKTARTFSFEI